MRILVVGVGATGGYFGGRLTQAGRAVTFLVRPGRVARLRENGLQIIAPDGSSSFTPQVVTADQLGSIAPFDVVLLAVKGPSLGPAITDIAAAVGDSTTIIPFLNGMTHLETLTARFGVGRVLGGVARIVASTDDDGNPVQYLPGASIELGEQNGSNGDRVRQVAELLNVPGYDLEVSDDIIGAMWHKWVFLASTAAITTLMRGTIGEIARARGGAEFAKALVAETAAISAAAGHPLAGPALAKLQAMLSDESSQLTASLYRDLVAGRPVEVGPVIGDLVDRAARLNVPIPLLTNAHTGLLVYEQRRTA